MKWQALFEMAAERPLLADKLAEHATATLFASGNTLAQRAFAATTPATLDSLCSVLDANGVPVPEEVARRMQRESRW